MTEQPRIVIAGGGVAAVEALLGLRALLGRRVAIEMISPAREFIYRPIAVAEPFGLAEPRRFDLTEIAEEHGAQLTQGALEYVDPDARVAHLHGDRERAYDVLLVAIGARPNTWLEGAVTFGGSSDAGAVRDVLAEVDAGTVAHVGFAAPPARFWALPLYELALLTAARLGERRVAEVRLDLFTPEREPLEMFGAPASKLVRELLGNRGIGFHGGVVAEPGDAERLIALPQLNGRSLPGLPADADGFIPVDAHGRVEGLEDVYAAGDGTAFDLKQGGLATQQADAAVEAIAAGLGAPIEPQPFRPTLRGMLLTGLAPAYLSARRVSAVRRDEPTAGFSPLWSPSAKIAGVYLAPFIEGRPSPLRGERMEDLQAPEAAPETQLSDHAEVRDLLLALADSEAAWGDYRAALRDLDALERIEGVLPADYAAKRADWQSRVQRP